jgi:hypothetical protein
LFELWRKGRMEEEEDFISLSTPLALVLVLKILDLL